MFDMFGSSSVGGAMSTPISASCPAAMKEDGKGRGRGMEGEEEEGEETV